MKVALPAVTALLAANVMLGVITRSAPQLNLFAFGLPITTALGLVLLLVALPDAGAGSGAALPSGADAARWHLWTLIGVRHRARALSMPGAA